MTVGHRSTFFRPIRTFPFCAWFQRASRGLNSAAGRALQPSSKRSREPRTPSTRRLRMTSAQWTCDAFRRTSFRLLRVTFWPRAPAGYPSRPLASGSM
eukprot:7520569-Pyramimonas_sp.AAC.2